LINNTIRKKIYLKNRPFLKMPKRRCVFIPILKSEFSFLRDDDEVGKSFCSIRKLVFSTEDVGLLYGCRYTTYR